ncbi:hypothetical protein [Bacillus cereus group sp. BfR-BA-01310]|uniref:hypothetical protein n=1 Tax=Bacillus cereus group sp. BfR-BA-01310 TaxID=2920287 RepID=UPI001F58F6F0|nr:hypothetical protein [Bacillus cereus group sp. BfR-BA-01310]
MTRYKIELKGKGAHDYLKKHTEQLGQLESIEVVVHGIVEVDETQLQKMSNIAEGLEVNIELSESAE